MHAIGHGSAPRFDRISRAVIQHSLGNGLSSNVKHEFQLDGSVLKYRYRSISRPPETKLNRSVSFIRSGLAVFPIDCVSGNGKRRSQKRCQSSLTA